MKFLLLVLVPTAIGILVGSITKSWPWGLVTYAVSLILLNWVVGRQIKRVESGSVQRPMALGGLSESEQTECEAFLKSKGIAKEMLDGPERPGEDFGQYLKDYIGQSPANKAWAYYLLGNWYFAGGKLKEAVSLYSLAISEYPADPRAYYALGAIYYSVSDDRDSEEFVNRPDFKEMPTEIQRLAEKDMEFQRENSKLIEAFRESKLTASSEEAANLAIAYFRKTLACNISAEDRATVQTHIRLIEERKSSVRMR